MEQRKYNLTKEDKIKLCARVFYQDNCAPGDPDSYTSFEEVLTEFSNPKNVSELFMESVVTMNLQPKEGHTLIIGPTGHIARIRDKDGYFQPITQMTQEEGEAFEAAFEKADEELPEDAERSTLFEHMGWKEVKELT